MRAKESARMSTASLNDSAPPTPQLELPQKRRNLFAACLAHMLHDGYTDQLYALLPVWQTEFGLSYAGLATVRALYYGMMSGFQVPGNKLVARLTPRAALAGSTLIAALGLIIAVLPFGLPGLCVGLLVAGMGSSIQHPRASLLVTDSYRKEARGPLGIYNFAGDLGKATLPALVAVLLPILAWRPVVGLSAMLGIAVAVALLFLLPARNVPHVVPQPVASHGQGRSGFTLLMCIGGLDTATRMGYLLFLPFLVHAEGGSLATVGLALALVFVGGAFGKATCNWVAQRFGVVGGVIATETATAALIVATLFVPLVPVLVLLPFLGVVLNGTSSILYGSVPTLAPKGDTGHAFAMFYTAISGCSGFAPIVYGVIADHSSRNVGVLAAAATALVIVPLILALRPSLGDEA
jgi:MFS family permease